MRSMLLQVSSWRVAWVLHVCFFVTLQQAHAGGGFSIPDQGAYALGSAFAGAPAGSAGVPSIYWNPATITGNPGLQSYVGISGVIPDVSVTPTDGTDPLIRPLGGTGDEAPEALIPNFYTTYQLDDQVWVGLSVNTPFGLGADSPFTSASQLYGRKSEVITFEVSPTIGARINDWLSVGASLRGQYFKGKLTAANTPFPGSPGNDLTADGFALGYAVGVTLTPVDGTKIGIGYRSSISQDISGDLTLDGPFGPLPRGRFGVETTLTLPDSISVGIEQRITDRFTLLASYEFTNWSRFDEFPVVFASGPGAGATVTTLAFEYDDGHYFSVGGEYKWSPELSLVAGVGYQISPISDRVRTVRLPESDSIWLSAGGRYAVNSRMSVDFGYAHIFPVAAEVDIGERNPAYLGLRYVGEVDASVDIVSVGISYRWD